jgi:LPXTG-motif cell wall-anchored protein
MRSNFTFIFKIYLIISTLGLLFFDPGFVTAAQQTQEIKGPYITVTFEDGVNVRTGPNTAFFPIIGHLDPGQTAPALGRTPDSDWIQIYYVGGFGDVGWVYAFYVTLTGGIPPVVPTPLPAAPATTPTVAPELLTALAPAATTTRLPTFTPPPPLVIPTFTPPNTNPSNNAPLALIIALAFLGLVGLLIFHQRRR